MPHSPATASTPLRAFLLSVGLVSLLLAPGALGNPGDLDFTFGAGGQLITERGDGSSDSVAIQSDGKIVVASGVKNDILVVRYEVSGSLDKSFGTDGMVVTDLGDSGEGRTVLLQDDGKIVVAGDSFGLVLLRYNSDGSVDTGFGTDGVVHTGVGSTFVTHVALQSDGKFVTGGGPSGGDGMVVRRFNSDGSADSTFGTGGKATVNLGVTLRATDGCAVVQSDGKIVVGGTVVDTPITSFYFGLVRLNSDGTTDNTFGYAGVVISSLGNSGAPYNFLKDIALQADGKVLITGGAGIDFIVARYNVDGTLDAGFGAEGVIRNQFPSSFDGFGGAVKYLSDGKILAAGTKSFGRGWDFVLVRYQPDGSLDEGFGTGGMVRTDFDARKATYDRAQGMVLQSDGRIVVVGSSTYSGYGDGLRIALARYYGGEPLPPPPPPVFDTDTTSAAGTNFRNFSSPAVDGGQVGGLATVATADGGSELAAYGGADGALLVQNGASDSEGGIFASLGDPTFGGEGVGFAGTVRQASGSAAPRLRLDARLVFDQRALAARPGGKLGALYSQLSKAGGIHRLAAQTDPAPGGGQFSKFRSFGLPRQRLGLLYAALLHHDGTFTRKDDFGIWRERSDGTGSDLLLRTGQRGFIRRRDIGGRELEKVNFMPPVTNATDQRCSFSPDGALAVAARFDDGTSGVVAVAADGTQSVPLDTSSPVPDEDGVAVPGIEFTAFSPPSTASGGRYALNAALRAAQQGLPPPPSSAVFTNKDGTLRRIFSRNDQVPGREEVRFSGLGQPLLGEHGMIGLVAALGGGRVQPPTRKAIVLVEGKVKAVAARLGEHASGFGDAAAYERFLSVVVTDSEPGRLVFTATVSGPGVAAADNLGLWSVSVDTGVNLLLRTGQAIAIGGLAPTVRSFDALKAPLKSKGQGRSTDASGFVTAKAKLSDGRQGVLRIPLP